MKCHSGFQLAGSLLINLQIHTFYLDWHHISVKSLHLFICLTLAHVTFASSCALTTYNASRKCLHFKGLAAGAFEFLMPRVTFLISQGNVMPRPTSQGKATFWVWSETQITHLPKRQHVFSTVALSRLPLPWVDEYVMLFGPIMTKTAI